MTRAGWYSTKECSTVGPYVARNLRLDSSNNRVEYEVRSKVRGTVAVELWLWLCGKMRSVSCFVQSIIKSTVLPSPNPTRITIIESFVL